MFELTNRGDEGIWLVASVNKVNNFFEKYFILYLKCVTIMPFENDQTQFYIENIACGIFSTPLNILFLAML